VGGARTQRWIIVHEVTPAQLGQAGAAQLALMLRTIAAHGKGITTRH
jgi:hypothetical protein